MSDFKQFVRNQSMSALKTVELKTLVTSIKADTINLVPSTTGKFFVHIRNSKSGDYYSIGVSPKADYDNLRDLIDTHVIYYGVNETKNAEGVKEKHPWFSYSIVGASNEPTESLSVSDLLGMANNDGVPAKKETVLP